MTRREREQVVELLRCAADLYYTERDEHQPTRTAAREDEELRTLAWEAIYATTVPEPSFHLKLLEAAARVEEGSWP